MTDENEKELNEIHRLMKLIHGTKTRFWYNDEKTGKETLFIYPPGTVENCNKKLNELFDKRDKELQELQK